MANWEWFRCRQIEHERREVHDEWSELMTNRLLLKCSFDDLEIQFEWLRNVNGLINDGLNGVKIDVETFRVVEGRLSRPNAHFSTGQWTQPHSEMDWSTRRLVVPKKPSFDLFSAGGSWVDANLRNQNPSPYVRLGDFSGISLSRPSLTLRHYCNFNAPSFINKKKKKKKKKKT